jgi:RNA polymerase sigma-70 factor (ECF subfamily)
MDTCDPVSEQTGRPARIRDDPDFPLVQALADGDERALEILYARHGPHLFAYLTGLLGDSALAEEVVQDVMLAAWRGAAFFRGESTVRTWLLAIARRRARRTGRRHTLPQTPLDAAAALPCRV